MLFSNSVSYGFARARDVGLSAPSLSASRPPSAVGVQEDDVRGTERPSLYLPSKGRCLTWRSTVSSEPCGRDGAPRCGKTCEGTEILQPRDGVPARCRRRKWPNVEHVFLFFFN